MRAHARPTFERITTRTAEEAVRSSLRARRTSNASPTAPRSPQPKSASPTAVRFSPTGPKFSPTEPKFSPSGSKFSSPVASPRSPVPKATPFKLPFSKRTPADSIAQRRLASTPARFPAHSRRALPDTPALSTFLRDQSTRIGHIGEADISLASSTSFRALTPPGGSTDADVVSPQSPLPARARRAGHRVALSPRSPLSPTSPLSARRARPVAAATELRAELARLKKERAVLETRVAALEAEEGRLTSLADAAMRDRQRALVTAESAEMAREAAMWEAVKQAADEAIEEEHALKAAIAAARAIVMAM